MKCECDEDNRSIDLPPNFGCSEVAIAGPSVSSAMKRKADDDVNTIYKKYILEKLNYYQLKREKTELEIQHLKRKLSGEIQSLYDTGDSLLFENPFNLTAENEQMEMSEDVMENYRSAIQIMTQVQHKLNQLEISSKTDISKKLIEYIRDNISKLDKYPKKKTTIGVFGKTGAGKSSLINAVLGERLMLPSGGTGACTSVIIQVEENTIDSKYTAEIEFITKKDWEDELKTLLTVLKEDKDPKHNAMLKTAKDKCEALYGKEYSLTLKDLIDKKNFSKIPEFLSSSNKVVSCENAIELSKNIKRYVRHHPSPEGCYWPLVKCVTIRIPNKDFLEHIVILDLPGSGDFNKSRDEMWKSKLGECSTVWIASEISRATDDKEAWEIFSNSKLDMAGGGVCSSIAFICTKTDIMDVEEYMCQSVCPYVKDLPKTKLTNICVYYSESDLEFEDLRIANEERANVNKQKSRCILHKNNIIKKKVKKSFHQQEELKRHFSCDNSFLSVYTVSSTEYFKETILDKEETEIPLLKDLLKTINKSHSHEMACQYIDGAHGILSLIEGCNVNKADMKQEKLELLSVLKNSLSSAVVSLRKYLNSLYKILDNLLSEGSRKSEEKCAQNAEEVLGIEPKIDGGGFHRILTSLCRNDGFTKSKDEIIDLNKSLALEMSNSVAKEFAEVFPARGKETEKSLACKIHKLTIVSEEMIAKYKHSPVLSHLLKFLQTEETKMKKMLADEILKMKKEMFKSISKSIQASMHQCYIDAAQERGDGSMKRKQDILMQHIDTYKHEMFEEAKAEFLKQFDNMKNYILQVINEEMTVSMKYSLTESHTMPILDVSQEIKMMKALAHICHRSSTEEL